MTATIPAVSNGRSSAVSQKRSLFSAPSNSASWIRRREDTSHLQQLTFGRLNRPSTPIYGVITGQYQRDWETAQQQRKDRRERKAVKAVLDKDVKAQHTLASIGHMKLESAEQQRRFTMDRFARVDKKIVTRWEQMPGRRGDSTQQQQQKSEEEEKTQVTEQQAER